MPRPSLGMTNELVERSRATKSLRRTDVKLVRYGPKGKEKPGLIDANGKLRDLSKQVDDISGANLSPASLKKLAKLNAAKLPAVKGNPRIGPCVGNIGK